MGLYKRYPNSILQQLRFQDFDTLSAELKPVELAKGTPLFEPDQIGPNTYFPISAVISFIGDTGEGGSVEVWAVGSEGVAGVSGIMRRDANRFAVSFRCPEQR